MGNFSAGLVAGMGVCPRSVTTGIYSRIPEGLLWELLSEGVAHGAFVPGVYLSGVSVGIQFGGSCLWSLWEVRWWPEEGGCGLRLCQPCSAITDTQTDRQTDNTTRLNIAYIAYIGGWRHKHVTVRCGGGRSNEIIFKCGRNHTSRMQI